MRDSPFCNPDPYADVLEIKLQDVFDVYDCERHPDVQSGRKSKVQVLNEALALLFKTDGCTISDFLLYHQ